MCGLSSQPLVSTRRHCQGPWVDISLYHLLISLLILGRKEIITFFYLYLFLTIASLLIDSGVVPQGSDAYPWFVAVQSGLTSAVCTSLLINGFVGFQLYEDGTTLSVWLLRSCSLLLFIVSFVVSILTFKGWAGLGPTNTVALFVVLYILNGLFLLIYVVMQIILVMFTLQDRWPLGDILFGALFFVAGQVMLYVFSDSLCEEVQHYMDGLFFATFGNLLAVMMVYKVCSYSLSLGHNQRLLIYIMSIAHAITICPI